MSQGDSQFWNRAGRARDKLAEQFLNHPEVSLIDIGYDPVPGDEESTKHIVLRVHLKRSASEEDLGLPTEIDGIPVRVVRADYKLE